MSADLRAMWIAVGGNVPEDWCFQTIESLLADQKSIAVGVMYPGENTVDGVPLIKVGDIKNGKVQGRPSFCISPEVDYEYRRTKLSGNELLITLVGEPGDCAIASEEMKGWNAACAIAVVRLADTDLRSWLRYVLLSKPAKHLIEARLNTTVQKTLNLKDIRALGVPVPSKLYRESVTKLLSALDDKITLNRQINQTLEAMAQAIFKSWFVDFDPVKAKIAAIEAGQDPLRAAMGAISGKSDAELDAMPRPQYDELAATAALFPEELVESELGDVPKGWENQKIGDFIERISVGKKFNQKSALPEGSVPILDQGKSGVIGFHNEKPSVFASLNKPVVVFANHTCYMRLITFDFSAIQNVLPFIGGTVDTIWAYYATKDKVKFSEYKGHWPDFVLIETVVPTLDLTIHFRKVIEPLVFQMRSLEQQSEQLAVLRDTLLPKLLSGELSVADLEEAV